MNTTNILRNYVSAGVLALLSMSAVSARDMDRMDEFAFMPSHTAQSEAATYVTNVNGNLKRISNHKEIVGADQAHKLNVLGQGVKVAVIDDVFDFGSDTEGALTQSCLFLAPSKGSSSFNARQISAANSGHNHANHVASTIAGNEGIAPQAKLRIIDLKNDPSTKNAVGNDQKMASAIYQAIKSKSDFISISMRIAPNHDWNGKISKVVKQAFYAARDAGIGVIKSAGNDSEVTGGTAYTRSLAKLLNKMNGYMRIAVATGYDGNGNESLASFSNRAGIASKYVLAAPGKDILAYGANNVKVAMSGTSMAAPVLSATATLVKSYNQKLTAAHVFDLLDRSARKNNLHTGSLLEPEIYGQGVVNAAAALKLADKEYPKVKSIPMAAQLPAEKPKVNLSLKQNLSELQELEKELKQNRSELEELSILQPFLDREEDILFARVKKTKLEEKKKILMGNYLSALKKVKGL